MPWGDLVDNEQLDGSAADCPAGMALTDHFGDEVARLVLIGFTAGGDFKRSRQYVCVAGIRMLVKWQSRVWRDLQAADDDLRMSRNVHPLTARSRLSCQDWRRSDRRFLVSAERPRHGERQEYQGGDSNPHRLEVKWTTDEPKQGPVFCARGLISSFNICPCNISGIY